MVLVLSIVPCADACEDYATNTSANTFFEKAPTRHGNENTCNDNCSPFCSCSCCSGFTVSDNQVALPERFIPQLKRIYNVELPSSIIEISLPIWQPPQLA